MTAASLCLPPEVTEQLEREDCPNWHLMKGQYEGGSAYRSCGDGHCDHGRVLAPRQVVALPETLTVECPKCEGFGKWMGTWGDQVPCDECGGSGRAPLPDGIYQLTEETNGRWIEGLWYRRPAEQRPLGSPVRVTHVDWENVRRGFDDLRIDDYFGLIVPGDLYDRLAARPHDGGVLLVAP